MYKILMKSTRDSFLENIVS